MPFTPSHVAAILPFARTPLPPAALVVGAMVPDLFFYVPLGFSRSFSHSLLGLVTVDLAFGLAAVAIWMLLRPAILDYLPSWARLRMGERRHPPVHWRGRLLFVALVAAAILLGAVTHVFWDGFTHADGPWVAPLGLGAMLGPLPIYKWLQHASTVLGILVIAVFVLWWKRRTPPADLVASQLTERQRHVGWLIVLGAGLAWGLCLWISGMLAGASPIDNSLVFRVVTRGIGVSCLAALVMALLWHARRGRSKRPSDR